MSASPVWRSRSFREPAVVAALLLLFAAAAVFSLSRESATFDETAHLPAGVTYLERGDFRLNPEHPPLTKLWAAWPAWLADRWRADYGSPAWRGRPQESLGRRTGASQWLFGYEFLNGPRGELPRRDPRGPLLRGRLAMVPVGLALGLLAYVWSRELWGVAGARLTLTLYCLSPTMLAHTRLVTTDLATALAFAAVLHAFWRLTRRPGPRRAAWLAAVLALSLLVKYSTLLLLPMLALLSPLTVVLARGRESRASLVRWLTVAAVGAAVAGAAALWAGYGFRYAAAADPGYVLDWSVVERRPGPLTDLLDGALRHRLLPEAYLYGLAYFLGGSARRLAYLNGETSLVGWWYYFPEAFLLKTPPATLFLLVWLGLRAARRGRWRSPATLALTLPVAIYVAVSMASHLNIGHRHLAPVYPLLFVLLGNLGRGWVAMSPVQRHLLRGSLLLALVSFAAATPGYLAYFNGFAGGSAGGARYLLDSNLDWGQDLPGLRRWMDRHRVDEIHLAYFGTADPDAYGIRHRKVLRVHDFHPERPTGRPGPGDVLAVSANMLHGLYTDAERELAESLVRRVGIDPAVIGEWLRLRDERSRAGRPHPPLARWLEARGLVDGADLARARRGLLSTWLVEVRRELEPAGRAGESIWIYRLP